MADHREQLVDELLVMDAQSGRVKAMEMLVARWQKRLWRYAYRLAGTADAAWDITQESWLAIVRGLTRLNDPAHFKAWAYRIVTNKARDRARRQVRRARAERQPTPRSAAADPDAATDLDTVLHRLPERSRTVLTLVYLEGCTVAEAAAVLGIPPGTVKSRLHTAKAEFRKLWYALSEAASPERET